VLPGGASQEITVRFHPTAPGLYRGAVLAACDLATAEDVRLHVASLGATWSPELATVDLLKATRRERAKRPGRTTLLAAPAPVAEQMPTQWQTLAKELASSCSVKREAALPVERALKILVAGSAQRGGLMHDALGAGVCFACDFTALPASLDAPLLLARKRFGKPIVITTAGASDEVVSVEVTSPHFEVLLQTGDSVAAAVGLPEALPLGPGHAARLLVVWIPRPLNELRRAATAAAAGSRVPGRSTLLPSRDAAGDVEGPSFRHESCIEEKAELRLVTLAGDVTAIPLSMRIDLPLVQMEGDAVGRVPWGQVRRLAQGPGAVWQVHFGERLIGHAHSMAVVLRNRG
jgi:hypothetical protein